MWFAIFAGLFLIMRELVPLLRARSSGVVYTKGHARRRVARADDPERFEDPRRFDASRQANRHIAFGAGAHQCLGLHLARLEMRILFEALLDRLDSIELAGEPRRASSTFVGGLKALPLRWKAS